MIAKMDITRDVIASGLDRARYITTEAVETVLYLALVLERPLLIEGPAGAARILGLNPNTLRSRMRKLGIRREDPVG